MRRLPPGWMQPSFRARSFLPDSTVQIAAASATAKLHLSKRAKKKPRYPVRVGAGFLGSGVDGLVVNRAEYPLQHAMRAEPADGWNGKRFTMESAARFANSAMAPATQLPEITWSSEA